jgi:hypothetical protein
MLPWPRASISRAASRGQETGIAGKLPDLAEDAFGGFEQRQIDICADVEDADLKRRGRVGIAQERGDLVLLTGIERTAGNPSAGVLDLGDERRQLFAAAPPGEHDESFGGEFPRDRGTDVVAGADDRDARVSRFHVKPPPLAPYTRQVVVALAQSRPSLSSSLPSAKAARFPTETTRPSTRTGPLASVSTR